MNLDDIDAQVTAEDSDLPADPVLGIAVPESPMTAQRVRNETARPGNMKISPEPTIEIVPQVEGG